MENVHVKWEVNILYSTVYIIYSGVYSVHNTAYGVQSSVQSQQLHYRLFTIYKREEEEKRGFIRSHVAAQ